MQLFFGTTSLIFNIVGYVPYIRDILRGIVRPQRVTWGIWTILVGITAANQILNDGGWSSLFLVSTSLLVTITFVLSIKYGVGGASWVDRICLLLAGALIVYWVLSQDTRFSTLIAVAIDAIGAVPTLIKTYRNPQTETYVQWVLAGIAGIFAMAAATRLDWALLVYPGYVVIMNSAIVGTKYFRERRIKPTARK